MKKKLIVAGCSFSGPSETLPGTSYAEVLARKLDWDLVHLARQGCSNGGIRIQIDEIIRQQPDFAVIAPTFHDRMELPASSAPYAAPRNENKEWSKGLERHLKNTELKNGYDPMDGIRNVNYNNQPYNMICETIFSLAENYLHPYRMQRIDSDTQNAVKQYVNHIYDSNWKLQMDTWIIRDGIVQAYLAGVKFIVLPDNLWTSATVRDIIPAIVPDRYLITNQELLPQHATWLYPFVGEDPGYHGALESQEYLADAYYKIITEWQDSKTSMLVDMPLIN